MSRALKVNKLTVKVEKGTKFSFDADMNALNVNELKKHSVLSFCLFYALIVLTGLFVPNIQNSGVEAWRLIPTFHWMQI